MPRKLTKLQQEALKLHTHVVVFKKGSEEERVAIKAQAGKTTKTIAKEMGLSEAQVQFRIKKAQDRLGVKFRAEYRGGGGFSELAEEAISKAASKRIQDEVAPAFVPLSVSRMNQ